MIDQLRILVFIFGLASFSLLEGWFPARPWHDSRLARFGFHIPMAIANSVVVRLVVFAPLLAWLNFIEAKKWGALSLVSLPAWLELALSLVVLDAFDYWWHRWNHRIGLLWRFHKVHHADTHVDVGTSLRFHPLELLFSGVAEAGWILVLGPSPTAYVVFKSALTLAAQFHHCNVDFGDRVERILAPFLVTPRFHAHHHIVELSQSPGANFSAIFRFWDRLFASCDAPKFSPTARYGLPTVPGEDLSWRAAIFARYR